MSVKRYSIDFAGESSEDPDGDYVKHSDFAALAAENEGLRAALSALVDRAESVINQDVRFYLHFNSEIIQAREALSRKAAP